MRSPAAHAPASAPRVARRRAAGGSSPRQQSWSNAAAPARSPIASAARAAARSPAPRVWRRAPGCSKETSSSRSGRHRAPVGIVDRRAELAHVQARRRPVEGRDRAGRPPPRARRPTRALRRASARRARAGRSTGSADATQPTDFAVRAVDERGPAQSRPARASARRPAAGQRPSSRRPRQAGWGRSADDRTARRRRAARARRERRGRVAGVQEHGADLDREQPFLTGVLGGQLGARSASELVGALELTAVV